MCLGLLDNIGSRVTAVIYAPLESAFPSRLARKVFFQGLHFWNILFVVLFECKFLFLGCCLYPSHVGLCAKTCYRQCSFRNSFWKRAAALWEREEHQQGYCVVIPQLWAKAGSILALGSVIAWVLPTQCISKLNISQLVSLCPELVTVPLAQRALCRCCGRSPHWDHHSFQSGWGVFRVPCSAEHSA